MLLLIRRAQIKALDAAPQARFRKRIVAHLRDVFPDHAAAWQGDLPST